jgi:hypothetical protein
MARPPRSCRHPDGSAQELAAAKRAVGQDAGLDADETPDRIELRLAELADRMDALAEVQRREDEEPKAEPEGDVG